MINDTYSLFMIILFWISITTFIVALVLTAICRVCVKKELRMKVKKWRNSFWLIGVGALAFLLILLFIVGSSGGKIIFGEIDTTVWSEFGSFMGGILLAVTLIYQIISFRRQQVEAKFFELIKYYRDNVSEMKLKNPFYYVDKNPEKPGAENKGREFDEEYVEGRRVFKIIFDQYRVAYGICKNSELVNLQDPIRLVHEKKKKDFSEYFRRLLNDEKVRKRFIENEIAYLITFWGVPDDFSNEIDDRLKKQYVLPDSKIPLLEKGFIDYFKSLVATYEADEPSKYSAMLKKWKNDQIKKEKPFEDKKPHGKMKFFGGHQYHLGHYFRHLYQAVTFINDQPWWLMDHDRKYEYIKTLRAQMSNYEQALLFINSLTVLGRNWEFNGQTKKQKLITKYNLIKNVPRYFIPDMNPADYYPSVDFEFKDDDQSPTKLPKPYCTDLGKIKAFVLGCDPTGYNKKGDRLIFEYVFNIGGKDKRYFAGILSNLAQVGLSPNDIYVQNLITDYQNKESSKNKKWLETAKTYIPVRKKEFDAIDKESKIPVFLTSELLYKALLNDNQPRYDAKELYKTPARIPVAAEKNKLGRPLIPLYRHAGYRLSKKGEYLSKLQDLFKT